MVCDTMRTGFEVSVCFGTNVLMITKTYKYLGRIVRDDLSDEDDIKSKERSLYGRTIFSLDNFIFAPRQSRTDFLRIIVVLYYVD